MLVQQSQPTIGPGPEPTDTAVLAATDVVTHRPTAVSGNRECAGTPGVPPARVVWAAAWGLTLGAGTLAGVGLDDLVGAHLVRAGLASAETQAVGPVLLALVAVAFLAERVWPAVPRPPGATGHLVDAGYLAIYALAVPAVTALDTGFALTVERYAPFLRLARLPVIPQAAVVAAIVLGIDATNWAAHVANHRVAAFWRFHALHHSQEEMSVLTTFRTHPLAHASYLPAVLPALVLASSGTVPSVGLVVYGGLVTLPHANLRWTYGRLGRWVVSPAFHRLHHASTAVDGRETTNFGFVLTVWDRLGGTATFPHERPVLPTGIAGRPVPVEQAPGGVSTARVVARQLAQPFRLHCGLES